MPPPLKHWSDLQKHHQLRSASHRHQLPHLEDPDAENPNKKRQRASFTSSADCQTESDNLPLISHKLISHLSENGWLTPTPIQRQAVPALLTRRELLAVAPTGKTLAQRSSHDVRRPVLSFLHSQRPVDLGQWLAAVISCKAHTCVPGEPPGLHGSQLDPVDRTQSSLTGRPATLGCSSWDWDLPRPGQVDEAVAAAAQGRRPLSFAHT